MKKKKVLEKPIEELGLSQNILSVLINNNLNCIEDLWLLKRKDLKDLKLSDTDINQITTKLQLNGIDLNKKIY